MGTAKQVALPKYADNEVVVCLESFCAIGDIVVTTGTRLRGDHKAVRQYPARFIRDGASSEERWAALQAITPEPVIGQLTPVTAPLPVLKDEDAVVAKHRVMSDEWSGDAHIAPIVVVEGGHRLPKTDPFAKRYASNFVPCVPQEGMTRENCLRAKTDLQGARKEAGVGYVPDGPLIYKGQWIAKDHPYALTFKDQLEEITDALPDR